MYDIFVVKNNNNFNSKILNQFPHAKVVDYNSNRLELFKQVSKQSVTEHAWIVDSGCDYSNFDFDYRPPWHQTNQLHVWPIENQVFGGDTILINTQEFLKQSGNIDAAQNYQDVCWKDLSLLQHITPEIFVWSRTGITSNIPGSTTLRYVGDHLEMMRKTISKATTPYVWILSDNCDYNNFDFAWRPSWAEETYLHVWPTENQVMGGDTFYVNVAEFQKQSVDIDQLNNYQVVNWHKLSIPEIKNTEVVIWNNSRDNDNLEKLKILFPNATVMRHIGNRFDMLSKTVDRSNSEYMWIISSDCDYTEFDFDYRPSWAEESYLHVWPTENQAKGGDTFYVNTVEFKKQKLEITTVEQYDSVVWHAQSIKQTKLPEIVIWDNGKNQGNLEYLKNRYPAATVLRNVGSRFDMMKRTVRHVSSSHVWIINSKCSYTDFDFSWRPEWSTEKHLHVWPTENQAKGGDTFYVDIAEFQKQCLEIEKLEYYDAVTWHKKNIPLTADVDIIVWSFGGNDENLSYIQQTHPNAKTLRYIGTHLEMLKKSVKYTDSEYFWILGDCCDYSDFAPNWRPDWETENSIHCWASGKQKFGDTLYVPKAQFLKEADGLEKLEYYSSIVWHENGYARLPWPVNNGKTNDIYHTVKNHKFGSIYEYFVAPGSAIGSTVDPSLWEKRPLIAYNRNGHVSLCPRDCISGISTRLLDYPYIQYHSCEKSTEKSQDIVFISYDEKDADLNWKKLINQQPAATRLHGVEGMIAALKIAANNSSTPWFYAVFAKTEVANDFKFDFSPNYLDIPGNYIFHAHNRITDYTYGHGAVILYHSKTVSEAKSWGFDFTTSFPYTYIPIMSCYNTATTSWEAWRTSFREALKLREMNTVESRYRLHRWLTVGNGPVGNWSIAGAKDAVEYAGGLDQANDWHWLKEYFVNKYQQHQ